MSTRMSFILGALVAAFGLLAVVLAGSVVLGYAGYGLKATPANANSSLQSTAPTVDTLSVSGSGDASAAPDVARLQLGVSSHAPTAQAAVDQTNQAQAAVIAAVKGKGVDPKDLQTSNYSVSAEFSNKPNEPNVITGYVASTSVLVTVRKVGDVGTILDAAVTAGANQISGISFGLADSEALLSQARAKAVANARAKADEMAKAAGVKLVRVTSLSESSATTPLPAYAPDARSSAAPIESGQTTVHVQVQITYAIEPQ